MARRKSLFEPFQKISGVKKVIKCKSCGKKIEVDNFNRSLCEDCGYRGQRKKNAADEETENVAESEA